MALASCVYRKDASIMQLLHSTIDLVCQYRAVTVEFWELTVTGLKTAKVEKH